MWWEDFGQVASSIPRYKFQRAVDWKKKSDADKKKYLKEVDDIAKSYADESRLGGGLCEYETMIIVLCIFYLGLSGFGECCAFRAMQFWVLKVSSN